MGNCAATPTSFDVYMCDSQATGWTKIEPDNQLCRADACMHPPALFNMVHQNYTAAVEHETDSIRVYFTAEMHSFFTQQHFTSKFH